MEAIPDATAALVVTSPPYFVGKEYEADVADGRSPDSYAAFLAMLEEVFAECVRVLEPGGRMAVNVANLGRKPYRSLSGDVLGIFERLGLLPRGEVIWQKARGASGSTAWGSFQSPVNPVLRDLTERIVIASKGRFDRAIPRSTRSERGLPNEVSIWRDEFLEATTDVWAIASESASAVGHPAPFPVELPRRLIELFTFVGDVVVDPFIGSGTTAVAAKMTDRRYIGYDTDAGYLEAARRRLGATVPVGAPEPDESALVEAVTKGLSMRDHSRLTLEAAGFTDVTEQVRHRGGVTLDLMGVSPSGDPVGFLVAGSYALTRPGLSGIDTLLRVVGAAAAIHAVDPLLPVVVLTSDLPRPGNPAEKIIDGVTGKGGPVTAVVQILGAETVGVLAGFP